MGICLAAIGSVHGPSARREVQTKSQTVQKAYDSNILLLLQ